MDKPNKKNDKKNEELLYTVLQFYASLFPRFYLLELTLKERIYSLLINKLGEDWFTAKLKNAENDPLFRQEKDLITRRKSKGFVLTDEGLKAESGLGFWTEFFNRRLYKEVAGLPIQIFTKLPSAVKRSDIHVRLERIREIRNQLVHSRIPAALDASGLHYIERIMDTAVDLEEILSWLGGVPVSISSSKNIKKEGDFLKKKLTSVK